jgi:hydrogen cyanide synthase HcnB
VDKKQGSEGARSGAASQLRHAELVIIGAGPAGVNAAIQFARNGVRSVLVDENPAIGGAIFRQPQKEGGAPAGPQESKDRTKQRAAALLRAFEEVKESVTLMAETQVVGVDAVARELTLLRRQRLSTLSFDKLVIATGCYEWPLPFPGWTLPGVSSVGGLQLQVKSGAVKPGRRAVLAGTGPLLLVAAKNLHEAGVQVLGVYEMGRRTELVSQLPAMLSNVELLREGMSLMGYLSKAGIPVHQGWGLVEARGEGELTSVVVAPHDAQGRPRREQARTLEVDCLGTSFGFVPRVQLTQVLGCTHELSVMDRALAPVTDAWQRSSLPGVYVAGDVGGVFGSEAATEQGKLAALGCLLDMERLSSEEAESQGRTPRSRLRAIQRFRGAFARYSALRPGMLELPRPETPICRCEAVTHGEIQQAIAQGATTLAHLKMATRAGMGDCQGKMCSNYCVELLARTTGNGHEQVGAYRPRFPLAPIPFSAFLETEVPHE